MCIPPVSRLHGGPGGPGASSRAATQQETKSRKGNILGGTMAATTSFCEDRRGKLWDQSLFLFPPCRPFILPAREDARPPGRMAERRVEYASRGHLIGRTLYRGISGATRKRAWSEVDSVCAYVPPSSLS